MTVRELIEKLQEMPPDAVIIRVQDETEDWFDVDRIELLEVIRFRKEIPQQTYSALPLRTWKYYPDARIWDREPYLGKFDRLKGVSIQ